MTARDIDVTPQPQLTFLNWLTPSLGLIGGLGMVLLGVVLPISSLLSMALVMLGAAAIFTAYILLTPSPILLVIPHVAVVLYLFLQWGGLCRSSCGDFGSYAYLFQVIPTAVAGMAFHTLAAEAIVRGLRSQNPQPLIVRSVAGVAFGISAFFSLRLILGGHWCPSCVACHVLMAAQAIAVVRLTPSRTLLQLWGAAILIGFLGTNAVFHHTDVRVDQQAGDRLLGVILSAEQQQEFARVVVSPGVSPVSPVSSFAVPAPQTPEKSGVTRSPMTPIDTTIGSGDDGIPVAGLNALTVPRAPVPSSVVVKREDRLLYFDTIGNCAANESVRMSMSLVCSGCRLHWAVLSAALHGTKPTELTDEQAKEAADFHQKIVSRLSASGDFKMSFCLSWPLNPEAHHGARLATYVVYAAGALGQSELVAALDTFYSPQGLLLMQTVNEQLRKSEIQGKISEPVEREAIIALIQSVHAVDPKLLAGAYASIKQRIDAKIVANINWLLTNGDLRTPHYYFQKGDPSGPPLLDTGSLDPEVWSAFVNKANNP